MTQDFYDLSDPKKNTPMVFEGYTMSDLSFGVSPYILAEPVLDADDIKFRNEFIVHQVDATEFGDTVGQNNVARVFAIQQFETHIYKLFNAAGRVIQAFTVFPRERLLVETTKTTTQSNTVATTESVLETASTEATSEIVNEVANETGSTKTQQTGWEASAQGGFGGIGANVKASGSETATETAKQLTKSIRKQSNTVSRSRKTEFKLHTEKTETTENFARKTRTFFNANYDSPMNVSVHESLGHYVILTQVVGQTLVYQSKSRAWEIRLPISSNSNVATRQVGQFLDQIANADLGQRDPNLEAQIVTALTLDVLKDDLKVKPGHYPPTKGFSDRETFKYKSEILEETFEFRLQGIPVDIDETQLPSGDVIGRAHKGLGDGRGELAKSLHDSIDRLMQERRMLAESGRKLIDGISEKMDSSTSAEEAQEWARLAILGLEALSTHDDVLETFEEPDP